MPRPRTTRLSAIAALIAVVALVATACSGSKKSVSLVAYSTPQQAYASIIDAYHKTADGKGVKFNQSFGASGAQSRSVAAGQKADIVAFSLAPDVDKLVVKGKVASNWADDPYNGMVTDSVAVLVVRKGNPKNIKDWADLIKPGVKVVTPNPLSSGSAQWNIMAAYGAQRRSGKSEAQAIDYLKALFKNVVSQDKSGRDALNTFTSGTGDVLISYENEAIAAQQAGKKVDFITPSSTILIENPVAVTKKASAQSKAFVKYLRTDTAQKLFAAKGYRPVVKADFDAKQFPTPKDLFTIKDLGGWPDVQKKFFDTDTGLMVGIEKSVGVSAG
jgi:sulfate/thiosulfate transport system substrate-binding protein